MPGIGMEEGGTLVENQPNQDENTNSAPPHNLDDEPSIDELYDKVCEGHSFVVSDLVWAKTQNQVWWPGMISDLSNAAKDDASFLVKHFGGNSSSVWCSSSDMKPFIEYFEEFSPINTSKSFTASVQKALDEISQRMESAMSCPCFTEKSQPIAPQLNENKVNLVQQFDPTKFYASMMELASTGSVPGTIDSIIMENCLRGFYRSVGHHQLTLQQLKPSSDGEDYSKNDAVTASGRRKRNRAVTTSPVPDCNMISPGTCSETRSRKKSKYLSYPYVDANKAVDASKSTEVEKSTSQATGTGTNSRKKSSKKHVKENHKVRKGDDIAAASSAELLEELFATALDSSYLRRSKYSDSLSDFYCSFRTYAFQDAKISSTLDEVEIEDVNIVQESAEGVNHAPVKENLEGDSSNRLPEQSKLPVKGNAVRKRRATKKKEAETLLNLDSNTDSSPLIPCVINFQRTWSDVAESEDKNVAAAAQLHFSIKPDSVGVQPSLLSGGPSADQEKPLLEKSNGAVVSPNVICQETACPSFPSLRDVPVTFQSIPQASSLTSVNSIVGDSIFTEPIPNMVNNGISFCVPNPVGPFPSSGVNGTSQVHSGDFIFKESNPTMISMGLGSPIQNPVGLTPSSGQPEQKKRKRKGKTTQDASAIPDLNGSVSDKPPTEGNVEAQPNGSGLGLNAKQRVIAKEDPGGGLLLKFAPEFPPTKETLVTIFSRFGLLKESEIQFDDNSSCTQIMYERSLDAGFAFRSLEKSNPFGESLVSFNLHPVPGADAVKLRKVRAPKQQPVAGTSRSPGTKSLVMETSKSPAKQADIAVYKKNVEMMKAALEKAGDSLSVEMRAKLENEIKSFLEKIGG